MKASTSVSLSRMTRPEAVHGEVTLIDEPVERTGGYPETTSGFLR